jgi:hypothetical protein
MTEVVLRAVGYWRGVDDLFLPHPRRLVRRHWRAADRPRIVRYLQGAAVLFRGMASSHCRFGCFRPDGNGSCPEMGGRDLTDGVWVWPEGLAHYVERHAVRLPDEFVATMAAHGWDPPPRPVMPAGTRAALASGSGGRVWDASFWRWWGFRHGGPLVWL